MTTIQKTVIFGAAGAGLLYLAAKARTVGNLIFMPGTIQGMEFNDLYPIATFSVIVQNTSGLGVNVDSFAGNLIANDILIGNVYNFIPVQLPPNSQTIIYMSMRLNSLGIVNDVIRAFQFRNFQQNVRIKGFVNSGILQIPLNLKFTFGG